MYQPFFRLFGEKEGLSHHILYSHNQEMTLSFGKNKKQNGSKIEKQLRNKRLEILHHFIQEENVSMLIWIFK